MNTLDRIAHEVQSRIPPGDLEGRDPTFIANTVEWAWLLARVYFRAEVRGLERVPADGPILLVGNHSGGNTSPELLVTTTAFIRRFGVDRPFFQLAHDLVMAYPLIGAYARRYGAVAACPDNARAALRSDAAVLVYPGGDWEVHRPSWEENRIEFAGRSGFLKTAWEEGVPIVPVVNIGAQETELILTRGDAIARFLRLDRMFRLSVFPISLAVPWGIDISDLAGHIPLPAKITVEFLDPIDLHALFGPELPVHEAYRHVTDTMQQTLNRLAAERRFPIVG